MKSIASRVRRGVRCLFPQAVHYSGGGGEAWFAGSLRRAPSIAEFFCGDDAKAGRQEIVRRARAAGRGIELAAAGAVSVLCPEHAGLAFRGLEDRAIDVPLEIRLTKQLPETVEALMEDLKTSTTREDLRRIRKAGFTYRVTRDPEAVRTFYARHYVPLVRQRFPDDGQIQSLDVMLQRVQDTGELVCADLEGEWVAGILNINDARDVYVMGNLGIRDADEAVRQKRVVAALLVQSMQRAVELGKPVATLGSSLPFLGKGPIWFKAKWGCVLAAAPMKTRMQILMDLRHAPVRRALAESPLIHFDGTDLAVSAWLPPGEGPASDTVRDAGRFPGIARWYVLGDAATLDAARPAFEASDRIVPIAVDPRSVDPLWLGQLLPRQG